jgi:hypothetical protein
VFDVGCRMVLSYDAYSETIEEKEQQDNEIQNIKQEMIMMQESHREILGLLKDPLKLIKVLKGR